MKKQTAVRENTPDTQPSEEKRNWVAGKVGKVIAGAILALEVNPITNEGMRLAALGATLKTTGDPVLAAAVYGSSTFAIEGVGGMVAADALDTPGSKELIDKGNRVLDKVGASRLPKMNRMTEAAVAMVAGTPALTLLKQREAPERTRQQNRRYSTVVSLGISAVCSAQGLAVAEGIHAPSTETIGLAALGVGSFLAGLRWANRRLRNQERNGGGIDAGGSYDFYRDLRGESDSPQNTGLDMETFREISNDREVLFAEYTGEGNVKLPVLVPTSKLYWYNQEMLKKEFGDRPVYFYTQLPADKEVAGVAKKVLEDGGVIIINNDDSRGDHSKQLQEILKEDGLQGLVRRPVPEALLNQYLGFVDFKAGGFKAGMSIAEKYQGMVQEGRLEAATEDGASIVEVVPDDEIDRLWEIYQKPFEGISTASPINAGYDEKGFKAMLKDPETIKLINKKDGKITTIGMFVTNFEHSPWLNESYYLKNYPEAYGSGNILIFTGIVSDENMRGSMYSLELMKLLIKVQAQRDSDALITFECNEVSSNYLPKIVEFAINHSDAATVNGLDRPIATSHFSTLSLVPA